MADTMEVSEGLATGGVRGTVARMRSVAVRALEQMYLPDQKLFCFCIRRGPGGDKVEGISRRYTAIVLISFVTESEEVARRVLGRHSIEEVCARLIDDAERSTEPGEVALTLWAARLLNHPDTKKVLRRVQAMDFANMTIPTVEMSWALTALSLETEAVGDPGLRDQLAARLMGSFRESSSLFPHLQGGSQGIRSHVCCYADLVYPTQALSYYYTVSGSAEAARQARAIGNRMCQLQGPHGEWWWHYDIRNARVVERFPVYSVHQDAMGPMALYALQDHVGDDHSDAIEKSVRWMVKPPELDHSLIDEQAGVIWRKVMRHEPKKLVRKMQAVVSGIHPSLRVPGVDLLFPPGAVDWESRPYHLGWLLHAFPQERLSKLSNHAG